jgi:quercetin dioxygenase-like cupin family protein
MSETPHPAPWHFNIHDPALGLPRKLAEGIQARVVSGQNVMISLVRIEPNTAGKIHNHTEEQWGVLLEGECTRYQGDETVNMKTGDFWYTPGGLLHGVKAGPNGALTLEIFSPPRVEYLTAGEGFGTTVKPPDEPK